MIRTLLFSTLYPSSVRPIHGIFVETRLRELLKSGKVDTRVVAPVPWFPCSGECFGEYGRLAETPLFEKHNGVAVYHPRYFLPPKVGMSIAPFSLAVGAFPLVKRLITEGFEFDLIDAHYYYPDGVAAALLAKWLGKPFVVTARGSDVNLIPRYAFPRRLMEKTAKASSASIGVSKALVDQMARLGFPTEKLKVFRNGVDTDRFVPEDKLVARNRLGLGGSLDRKILLSVGNLVELKGHDIAIQALAHLDTSFQLLIVGAGSERQNLQYLANLLDVADRVLFAGRIANTELKWWYSAADVVVLCSSREGWPNVLLEAMACGTPVVATRVGGVQEIVANPVAGRLMDERSPAALVDAVRALLSACPEAQAVRRYADSFDWHETTRAQVELFREVSNA